MPAAVIVFVITQQAPAIMILALLIALYLTVWDLWNEDIPLLNKVWWVLLVFILHVLGYVIFRAWLAVHRSRREA